MTRILLAGLVALTACQRQPEAAEIDRNATIIRESLARQADMMEAMANKAVDPGAANALQNAADRLEDAKDNIADAADAAKDELKKR